MISDIIKALEKKYEADIAEAEANIGVYISNPAGIGEHSDLVAAVDGCTAVTAVPPVEPAVCVTLYCIPFTKIVIFLSLSISIFK